MQATSLRTVTCISSLVKLDFNQRSMVIKIRDVDGNITTHLLKSEMADFCIQRY